jgi:hypothetical protein
LRGLLSDDSPGSTDDIPGAAPLDISHPVCPNYTAILRPVGVEPVKLILSTPHPLG